MSSIAYVAEPSTTTPVAPRILVLCYSRSGTTKVVGKTIAAALGADFEEIRITGESTTEPRSYARCGLDILLRRKVKLAPLAHDLAQYAVVVIGTPVWMARTSSPVRTFLKQAGRSLPPVAFFLTHGGTGRERVFAEMEQLVGRSPVATVAVNERDYTRREYAGKVAAFVGEVRGAIAVTA